MMESPEIDPHTRIESWFMAEAALQVSGEMPAYLGKSMRKSSYPKKEKIHVKVKYQIISFTKIKVNWEKKIQR